MRWARQQPDITCDRTLMPFPIYDLPGNEIVDNRWRRGTHHVTVTHHVHFTGGGMDLEVHAAGWRSQSEPTSALTVLRVLAALDLIPAELAEPEAQPQGQATGSAPTVEITSPDDEHVSILIGGVEIASANHDEHGWSGMDAVVRAALAVAEAAGLEVEDRR